MLLLERMKDPQFMAQTLIAICIVTGLIALAMPYFGTDPLQRRMKSVTLERDRLRQRERETLIRGRSLRSEEKSLVKKIVIFSGCRNGLASKMQQSNWQRRAIVALRLRRHSFSFGLSFRWGFLYWDGPICFSSMIWALLPSRGSALYLACFISASNCRNFILTI